MEVIYAKEDTYEPDMENMPPVPPVNLPWTRIIGIFKKA